MSSMVYYNKQPDISDNNECPERDRNILSEVQYTQAPFCLALQRREETGLSRRRETSRAEEERLRRKACTEASENCQDNKEAGFEA